MSELLLEINRAVDEAGGSLDPPGAELFRQRYREVLTKPKSSALSRRKRHTT